MTDESTAQPGWFGPADRRLLGWMTAPVSPGDGGVLIVSPIGYEWWSSHRTLRALAERLSSAGHRVLRYDHFATGDSSGDDRSNDVVEAWRSGVRDAMSELRASGARRLAVVCAGVGASLVASQADQLDMAAFVAWAPVADGRQWSRRLRLIGEAAPGESTVALTGLGYDDAMVQDLSKLRPRVEGLPGLPILLVSRDAMNLDRFAATFASGGADVTTAASGDDDIVMEIPAEEAVPPQSVLSTVTDWLAKHFPSGNHQPVQSWAAPTRTEVSAGIHEQVISIGSRGLVGVETVGEVATPGGATMVLLNSGSEPHVGPGRTWVDLARQLAKRGHRVVRVDMSGWGESPDCGHAPGRPYDEHGIAEAVEIAGSLRADGPVALSGLCAGAWTAFEAASRKSSEIDGVLAINPQLYFRRGDPIEALLTTTRKRRSKQRLREERGRRWGLWSVLDFLGSRPISLRAFDATVSSGIPVQLIFAASDDGLEWLTNRCARHLDRLRSSGRVRLATIDGIDHQMYRFWLRSTIVDVCDGFLNSLASAHATGSRHTARATT